MEGEHWPPYARDRVIRANITSNTDHDDGVACKHGPSECLGNIIELCAAKIYPTPRMYLGFTMCMSNQFEDIPQKELVEECALEHGMSFNKIQACADAEEGAVGVDMLRTSVRTPTGIIHDP